jgi:hypothetical protein
VRGPDRLPRLSKSYVVDTKLLNRGVREARVYELLQLHGRGDRALATRRTSGRAG